jgi:hypothetical protein
MHVAVSVQIFIWYVAIPMFFDVHIEYVYTIRLQMTERQETAPANVLFETRCHALELDPKYAPIWLCASP